jgi:D-xylose 1-dehydrogenase (NADP+, D-xylono-1,5-lactone-forming)
MMSKLRWGLLSTAKINGKLIPAIRNAKQSELVAVASRGEDKARSYARQWHIPHYFGSYENLLASDEVDVVYIGLPNHMHAEWMIKAMRAGKHVLCEKPFVLTLDEFDQVQAVQKETGMKVMEGFMYRHHPQTNMVLEMIAEGKLGDVLAVDGIFQFKLQDPANIRWNPKFGGGSLWDVGLYPMSFVQLVMGEAPINVVAKMRLTDRGVDDLFVGQMEYSGSRFAQIRCGFSMPYATGITILGTEGRIHIDRPFNDMENHRKILFVDNNGKESWLSVPKFDLYTGEVEDLNNAILEDRAPLLSLEETRNHIRTLIALSDSAKENREVVL